MARRSFVVTPLVKVSPANQKLGFGSLGFLIVFLRNLSFQSLNKTSPIFLETTCRACLMNKPDFQFWWYFLSFGKLLLVTRLKGFWEAEGAPSLCLKSSIPAKPKRSKDSVRSYFVWTHWVLSNVNGNYDGNERCTSLSDLTCHLQS